MKLITLCAVFSVVLAVSLASPARNQIRDISDSSSSSEENVADEMSNNIVADNEEDSSSSSSEEVKTRKKIIVVDEDDILDIKTLNSRSKRSYDIDNNWNSNNHIKVKDEGSIKYDKYLKLKRVRRATSNESSSEEEENLPAPQPGNDSGLDFIKRLGRSAETSEENSSEEEKKPKQSAIAAKPDEAPAESVQPSAKPDAAPEESQPKPEEEQAARRRRSLDDSSEENQSMQEQEEEQDNDANEVFIFNNEKQDESEETFNSIKTENNKYVVLNDKEQTENVNEKKISEEDYAQGCGENESNENSNENNETTYDIQ